MKYFSFHSHSEFPAPSPRCRRRTMKIEQKMETGGTNNTNTPILKFLRNFPLFDPVNAARHIEHCASTGILLSTMIPMATTKKSSRRQLKYFITAPLRVRVRLVVLPETYNADLTNGSCPGKRPSVNKYRPPASAPASQSNSNAQTLSA